jgi:hypothetical protein
VAASVAAGNTNREVADALFVCIHTVEANLKRIYRKLGVRSRTELASRFGSDTSGPESRAARGSALPRGSPRQRFGPVAATKRSRDPALRRLDRTRPTVSVGDASLAGVDAAIWTAIGLLAATSLGTLFYLGSKIDVLGARLDGRIDALSSRVDSGFARVDAGFARVDERFGRVGDRFDAVNARLDAINERLSTHLDRHVG